MTTLLSSSNRGSPLYGVGTVMFARDTTSFRVFTNNALISSNIVKNDQNNPRAGSTSFHRIFLLVEI